MLVNGRDTDDPRDWEPSPLSEVERYAREHPDVKATIHFHVGDWSKSYRAVDAVGVTSCALNRGSIKNIECEDERFLSLLWESARTCLL